MRIFKIFLRLIGIGLLGIGIALFIYPNLNEYLLERQTTEYVKEFNEKYQIEENKNETKKKKSSQNETKSETKTETKSESNKIVSNEEKKALLKEIKAYNKEIYESKQVTFKDAWDYTQAPFFLKNLDYGKFGYIKIPAMNVCLPLYLGASDTNMAHGAAVLGGTSIPIGGKNTNSAIVGHRGWNTGKFFKYIERLKVGHHVYITNPFGTLTYEVESIKIINPSDVEEIKIQEERDMITLVTCHPYATHGKMRYLVFCKRVKGTQVDDKKTSIESNKTKDTKDKKKVGKKEDTTPLNTSLDVSSELEIKQEENFRTACAVFIVAVLLLTVLSLLRHGIRGRRKK